MAFSSLADSRGRERDPVGDHEQRVLALFGPLDADDVALVQSVDVAALSPSGRLACLQALDRLSSQVASRRAEVLVSIAGEEASGAYLSEVALEHEVAVARTTSRYAAGRAIENARALATCFPRFAAALRAGEVSEAHCSALVERTRNVADAAALDAVEERVLNKARRLPVGRFGQEVAKAVAVLDPDASGRHRRARADRCVYSRPLEDGMGFLGMVDEWSTIAAIQRSVDADALALRAQRRSARAAGEPGVSGAPVTSTSAGSGTVDAALDPGTMAAAQVDDVPSLDACRADALGARVLGSADADGVVTWQPRESTTVTLELVMDLPTLRGEADGLALLDGQPIPAGIAREWADLATTWRRVVTDPVDGHLLDYGTRQYLPDRLRRFVLARDGACRAPDCGVRDRRRVQMDHAVPFPTGATSAVNCGALCTTCHQLKTDGRTDVVASRADGSATWTTALGQRVELPPRPYLDAAPPTESPPTAAPSGECDAPPF